MFNEEFEKNKLYGAACGHTFRDIMNNKKHVYWVNFFSSIKDYLIYIYEDSYISLDDLELTHSVSNKQGVQRELSMQIELVTKESIFFKIEEDQILIYKLKEI